MFGMTAGAGKDHLIAFAHRLKRLLEERHWSAAELAREASKLVPESHRKNDKRHVIGRHLISAYCRGENEPSRAHLTYIAKALGVEPESLLPIAPKAPAIQTAQAITSLDGKTRLIIDVEVDTSVAMEVLATIRSALTPKTAS
ncbi:helix-turn-helix transcriptional regulator [Bradyrhizobium sp. 139]|uniref:helix-turn-helix transcriptional regulator n=1 Tax=Bradyrhizobium sp. 139 TaxID=2782616 RepID=UPI001FFA5152|nr:helix-turn-helix transcriptional regulator [Bradyrhizobium sp. 139]MCK1742437.1 helix-turn-helix transcriptional regulator [Bradyrhizobium sp. 139]